MNPVCVVCGLAVVRGLLCPGCWLAWRTAESGCSQEAFEAWCEAERAVILKEVNLWKP